MDNEEKEIKDCFAYFGRTMYSAQVVEKAILNSLLFTQVNNITKERYDEILAEKSLLTFGQLKQEIIVKGFFAPEFIEELEKFHQKRDWLAHNYWWDRSVEFGKKELRPKILNELDVLYREFEKLNDLIEEILMVKIRNHGIDFDQLIEEHKKLDETPKTPEFRKLTKNETLIGLFSYESAPNSQIPIFKLQDNTYWSLCEIGLTSFSKITNDKKLIPLEKTKHIFPVLQFNPRPKISEEGKYELDLKKDGLFMKVERIKTDNSFLYKWGIRKK
jgi:hypothetical protein